MGDTLLLYCFDENAGSNRQEKLSMRVETEGWNSEFKCSFPKHLRVLGRHYEVPVASISTTASTHYTFISSFSSEVVALPDEAEPDMPKAAPTSKAKAKAVEESDDEKPKSKSKAKAKGKAKAKASEDFGESDDDEKPKSKAKSKDYDASGEEEDDEEEAETSPVIKKVVNRKEDTTDATDSKGPSARRYLTITAAAPKDDGEPTMKRKVVEEHDEGESSTVGKNKKRGGVRK